MLHPAIKLNICEINMSNVFVKKDIMFRTVLYEALAVSFRYKSKVRLRILFREHDSQIMEFYTYAMSSIVTGKFINIYFK